MSEFSYRTRLNDLNGLKGGHTKCLIIGGGIVGAGLASVLSQNGVDVVLAEKGDFASGTSSGSSKLIHGGIRYLAQGHIKLTRDLLRERNYLIRNTDIVKRLDFDILVDRFSWSPSYMRFGLFLYSILGGRPEIPRLMKNKGEYPDNVRGYFPYFDGVTDDARLVIYNMVSAHDSGAKCLNYLEAVSISDGDSGVDARMRDNVSGEEFSLNCDVVVNCTGPWINTVLEMYRPGESIPLKLSKGVHLVFDRKDVPAKRAITFRSHLDRRQMFIIPREKVCIVGTTETVVEDPSDFSISDGDIGYIVESASRLVPGISRDKVLSSYSGIRPLIGRGNDPDRITRDFSIFEHGRMVSVAGVKITDFRHAARKIAARVASIAGVEISTRGLPVISYSRASGDGDIEGIVLNECPVYVDDVLRRRIGTSIYDPLGVEEMRKTVSEVFARTGVAGEVWQEP